MLSALNGDGTTFEERTSLSKNRKQVVIPLAPGYEEIEAIGPADVLARAGIRPVLACLPGQNRLVQGSHRLAVRTEASLDELTWSEFAGICLPGGMPGAQNLLKSTEVAAAVRTISENGGLVAAICAAPLVLQAMLLTTGKRVTSHPTIAEQLHEGMYREQPVVVDPPLITSRGPGTALLFGLTVVAGLSGVEKALAIAAKMVVPIPQTVENEWARFGGASR